MADRSQFLRGTLEGCILKIIGDSETYGYEIAEKLMKHGFTGISEGTIYPLLLRLEKNGMIDSVKKDSTFGPKRKYYSLTDMGKKEIREFYAIWCEIQNGINQIFDIGEEKK